MLKLSETPPILPPSVESLAQLAGPWWIAHTRSRFEKAFAWDLIAREVPYFLPMIERVTVSGGRKRRQMAPLFPSYVFFCGCEDQRLAALMTNRLCQVIPVPDQQTLTTELTAIERALSSKAQLDPYPFAAVGRRCRVTAGPFQGCEGVVVRRDQVARLVLQVSILGAGAALEIDSSLLEPVGD
jgi:transcription antitermination factor NusG